MDPAATDVCLAAGSHQLLVQEGVRKIVLVLHDYSAPGALEPVYQDAARCLHSRHAAPTLSGLQASFDLLRRKEEGRTQKGVPILCSRNAFMARAEKSLGLATFQRSLRLLRRQGG